MTSRYHELKFAEALRSPIDLGKKYTTWRLNNERDFQVGDELDLLRSGSLRLFGCAAITRVAECTFATLTDEDFQGHEPFGSFQEMLDTYSGYYHMDIEPSTPLTVVRFRLSMLC